MLCSSTFLETIALVFFVIRNILLSTSSRATTRFTLRNFQFGIHRPQWTPPFRKYDWEFFLEHNSVKKKMLTHTGNNSNTRRFRDQFGFQSFPTITSILLSKLKFLSNQKTLELIFTTIGTMYVVAKIWENFSPFFFASGIHFLRHFLLFLNTPPFH